MLLFEALDQILARLKEHRVQSALLGGLATSSSTPVRVARVGHLVALKLLAYDPGTRPQDALDLNALRAVLDSDETKRADDACELIMRRGYARERNLPALLRTYLSENP